MLKGYYKLNDNIYYLSGYDFGDNIAFYMTTPVYDGVKLVDYGITIPGDTEEDDIVYPPTWDKIYVSIGSGNVSVSCFTEQEGKILYKNAINKQFYSRLGSIIRGMISACNRTTQDDVFELMADEFIPKQVLTYSIGDNGKVALDMKSLKSLAYRNTTSEYGKEELYLDDDDTFSEKVVRLTNLQHKVKLDLSEFIFKKDEDDSWDFEGLDDDKPFSLSEIIERNPHKSYVWLKGRKYHIVNDIKEAEKILKEIWEHDGIVAFDTETTGLNITFLSRYGQGDRLVGMVFSIEPGEAWYFPIAHKKIKNLCTPENEKYIIEKYFKPILEKKKLVCHNGSFDWKVMYIYDICCNIVHDALILFKVTVWNDNRSLGLSLKNLTSLYLGRDSFELSDFVQGKWGSNNIKFWDLEEESVKYYACPDTDNLLELLEFALKSNFLGKYGAQKTYEIEVAFSLVIAYQEFYGHCVDVNRVEELVKEILQVKEVEYKAMVELVGHDFNPRSNPDIAKICFEEFDYPIIDRTDTGNPSMGKNVRKILMDAVLPNGEPKYPFVHHLHRFLEYAQLESNFTKNIDKFATEDGFMFSEVTQFLETGRVSCSNPNYQSYSDEVKKYIIPRKGFYALDADYSSIEYRILACMAKQENLIKRFYDPDMDYHTYQASRMFKTPYELVTKSMRQNAKGINFGIPYGMGDPKLGERLFGERTPENTLKAKKMKRIYFEGQENIEQFFIDARANGVANSFSDTYFGRRRYFDKRRKDKGSIEREAGNNRIQGTAADIYKIAMVRLFTEIRKQGLMGKILISAFVHDECFLEIHKSIDPAKMLKLLRSCLMLNIDGWCPLYTGAGFGTNWYDAKKTEIPVQVQEIIVNEYGDSGLDFWNGDTSALFTWEVGMINGYKRDRVINYLKDENNWGKVFAPVENGFAHEVIEEILKGRKVDGVVTKDISTKKDMLENLYQFCKAFGLEELYEKANIQKPVYKESEVSNDLSNEENDEEPVDVMELVKARLNTLGVSIKTAESENDVTQLYFRLDKKDPTLMRLVRQVIERNPGTVEVLTFDNGEVYTTGLKVNLKCYSEIMRLYLSRANSAKG